ncbi:hypothetical protein ACM61V_15965 [Sphingomonas sp. TX0543]|uniref:hypothetical protein n=1 Tax=unclassified Sphingomonas TaxID=196159 RepID=UPI003815F69A
MLHLPREAPQPHGALDRVLDLVRAKPGEMITHSVWLELAAQGQAPVFLLIRSLKAVDPFGCELFLVGLGQRHRHHKSAGRESALWQGRAQPPGERAPF